MVADLVLRYLWLHGSGTLAALNEALKLSFPVLETLFHQFRQQQLLEVKGMTGNDYSFTLTAGRRPWRPAQRGLPVCGAGAGFHPAIPESGKGAGRARASEPREPAPRFRRPGAARRPARPVGPALIGHQSLFLYGGTGNGKTSIAERILRIFHDVVVVPYAVEVDGHVITLFDPVVHRPVPFHDELLDPRWVVCERPCITVGGELSAAMLELRLDESTKVFISPCQMKANNGILIIDDFGRQMLSPRELLNRWIVPLDRRVDYLTLASGMKFQVPFELMVVFSTNLDPHDLADEAFLRRIQTKVLVENVSPEIFDQIFQRVVRAHQAPCEPGCAEHLRERCEAYVVKVLRACYPMDIYRLVKAISEYEGRPVRMTRANIDRAVALYFAAPQAKAQ